MKEDKVCAILEKLYYWLGWSCRDCSVDFITYYGFSEEQILINFLVKRAVSGTTQMNEVTEDSFLLKTCFLQS